MILDALFSHYATRNVTPQVPLALMQSSMPTTVMERYGGQEGIEELHCGLHSDYIVCRESIVVTSDVNKPVLEKNIVCLQINLCFRNFIKQIKKK